MYKELLINVLQDILFFSLIEGVTYCYFYQKIYSLRKFKWYEFLILTLGNSIISQIFMPIIYQILMLLWMILFLINTKRINKILKAYKYVFYAMIFLLITEAIYIILRELNPNFNFVNMKKIDLFINILPIKFLQLLTVEKNKEIKILIIGGCKKMKTWFGTGTTRK